MVILGLVRFACSLHDRLHVGQPDQLLLPSGLQHPAKGGGAGRRADDEGMDADRDDGGLAVGVGSRPRGPAR